jgi:hypothetical protein
MKKAKLEPIFIQPNKEDSKKFTCIVKGAGYKYLIFSVSFEDEDYVIYDENCEVKPTELLWALNKSDIEDILTLMTKQGYWCQIHKLPKINQDDFDYLNENYPEGYSLADLHKQKELAIEKENYEKAEEITKLQKKLNKNQK